MYEPNGMRLDKQSKSEKGCLSLPLCLSVSLSYTAEGSGMVIGDPKSNYKTWDLVLAMPLITCASVDTDLVFLPQFPHL